MSCLIHITNILQKLKIVKMNREKLVQKVRVLSLNNTQVKMKRDINILNFIKQSVFKMPLKMQHHQRK